MICPSLPESVANELGRAYGLGRIAGIREAASWLPHAGLMRAAETKRKLRAYAAVVKKKTKGTR